MGKVKFIFCTHNHQPVGNFRWVFEKAYQVAYKPFLQVMIKHPKIKWNLHASGILWDFISKEHPEYIKDIKKLVGKGNLEILSGGFYEPIMSVIPDRDKINQIKKLTSYLKDTFGCAEANGIWLAERVWEPGLAKVLYESAIQYTVLDDAHFAAAGMDADFLRGYYTTEEQGCSLNIFPISQQLRYLIPFQDVEKTIEFFRSIASNENIKNPVFVMADDGEKFGMWPGTNKHVYENGWLERFLTAIEANSDFIETTTFSEVLKTNGSSGRVYLPCASYFEMSEWSLPNTAQQKFENVLARYGGDTEAKTFMRGGFWRNFLSKYEESNNMHKKMLYVSAKADKFAAEKKPSYETMLENLYAGQCNCAYWHGVFGGLYLPHLRNAVYNSLLKSEAVCNKSIRKPQWTAHDFDCDKGDEYLYESKTQNIYVDTFNGGTIFEFDIFKINHNLLDVLTRRYESYHKKLKDNIANAVIANDNEQEAHTIHSDEVKVKEAGLDKFLVYDWHRRSSLADHFLGKNTSHEDFMFARFRDAGDFVLGEYKASVSGQNLVLERDGKVDGNDVKIVKTIIPIPCGYKVKYKIQNNSKNQLDLSFAPDQVFAFSSKTYEDSAEYKEVSSWKRYDDIFKIEVNVNISEKCGMFVSPIETIASSENGYERTYQGTSVLPILKKLVNSGDFFEFEMETTVK